jgi:hypothetical protein
MTQAILAGDYQAVAAIRARQTELERQLQQEADEKGFDPGDAQVIGARNPDFTKDEKDAMGGPDPSWLERQSAAEGPFGSGGGSAGGEEGYGDPTPFMEAAPQPPGAGDAMFPGKMRGVFDPKTMNDVVERNWPSKRLPALFGQGGSPGFGFAGRGSMATVPRAGNPRQVAALPKGATFIAPDGSIRKKNMMPQNWWEMFPEVQPSPAARPRSLAGPGSVMPDQAMRSPYGGPGQDHAPPGAFDSSYFSGDARLESSRGLPPPPGQGQPSFAGKDGAPEMDRDAAIQLAALAIQRGADPSAVRARLGRMGFGDADLDPPEPFADLAPDARQMRAMMGGTGVAPQSTIQGPQSRPAQQSMLEGYDSNGATDDAATPAQALRDASYLQAPQRLLNPDRPPLDQKGAFADLQPGLGAQLYPAAYVQDHLESLQDRAIADQMARQRGGDRENLYRAMHNLPPLPRPTPPSPPRASNAVDPGERKSPHPMSRPDVDVTFSSPRRGGPRTPVPSRSYSVRPYHLGGGLNGYGYNPRPGDAQLLARLIYSESGITPEDMLAIGWAAVNRVGFRNHGRLAFGTNLADVVSQRAANGRYAYSFLNDGGSEAWRRSANPSSIPDPAVWARAVATANAILSRRASDPSGGAQYFFASPTYVPGDRSNPPPSDFPTMLRNYHYVPTPYQSASTHRDRQGRLVRNYFFRENPEKLWAPQTARQRSR